MWVPPLGQDDPLEEGMATHPSIPDWRARGQGAWRPEFLTQQRPTRLSMRARCVASVRATSCPVGTLCPWNFPGKNT